MDNVSKSLKSLYGYSGKTVDFLGRNLGLRMPSAPPLKPEALARLKRALRLLVMVALLIGVAYGLLIRSVAAGVDAMLASEKPGFDVEQMWNSWTWQFYASLGLLAASFCLLLWAVSLFRHFRINLIFLAVAALLCVGTLAWRPCARIVVQGKLLSLYEKGFVLWVVKDWKQCYRYYERLYRFFPSTFIADNCLGRMAGSEYQAGNYGNAIRSYAELLRVFAKTDIRENVETSVRWTMEKLWANRELSECVATYREASLGNLGFSVYEFFMPSPESGEAARPELFGSFGDADRENSGMLMKEFPNDKWSDRAAFFAGDGEALRERFPNSRYSLTSGVVEGWDLHKLQNYAEAAKRYVAFLNTKPPKEEQSAVRHLLTLCYLASQDLEEAFTNLQAAAMTEHSIPARDHYLFLARFAFMESSERMKELFERISTKMPSVLAADMAAILAERLDLAGTVDKREVSGYRALAARLIALSEGVPSKEYDIYRVSQSLLQFSTGDDLVSYANVRSKQTANDDSFVHYLDRNYAEQRHLWIEAQNVSYTGLLHGRVRREFDNQLATKTNVTQRLKFAAELLERLKDNAPIRDSVAALVKQLDSEKHILNDTQLVLLRRICAMRRCEHLDSITTRALRSIFSAQSSNRASVVRQSFRVADTFPRDLMLAELGSQLRQLQQAITNSAELWAVAGEIDTSLRRAKFQTRMAHKVVPVLMECYSRVHAASPALQTERTHLELSLFCLRNPQTYDLASQLLEDYLTRFPKSDYCANCRLWIAWLWCYEANRNRDLPSAYETCYHKALTSYLALINTTCQERLDILGRDAARKIRRKLTQVSTGEHEPTDYRVPEEILRFALPSSLLDSKIWNVHYTAHRGGEKLRSSKLRFDHGVVKAELFGQEIQVPFHLTVHEGKMSFRALAHLDDEETYVLRGTITDQSLHGTAFRADRDGRIVEVNRFVGGNGEMHRSEPPDRQLGQPRIRPLPSPPVPRLPSPPERGIK